MLLQRHEINSKYFCLRYLILTLLQLTWKYDKIKLLEIFVFDDESMLKFMFPSITFDLEFPQFVTKIVFYSLR